MRIEFGNDKVILDGDYMASGIKVVLDDGAFMPTKAHEDDAGFDLRTPKKTYIAPGGCAVIDTGVHVEIPHGCVGMVKSKSGLNVRHGILSEGVIDSGYTGSIVAKLYNFGQEPITFEAGEKITQLVIMPICIADLVQADSLDDTERGANGFGSSGK